MKGTGRLAGADGLCVLEGHPEDVAEVGHQESGPSANSQVLAAVDGLVWDGRKASTVHPRSPGAKVSSLVVPNPRRVCSHLVEVGVAEADGIAVPAIEVLEVALTEEITPEPEAGRRSEDGAVRQ